MVDAVIEARIFAKIVTRHNRTRMDDGKGCRMYGYRRESVWALLLCLAMAGTSWTDRNFKRTFLPAPPRIGIPRATVRHSPAVFPPARPPGRPLAAKAHVQGVRLNHTIFAREEHSAMGCDCIPL